MRNLKLGISKIENAINYTKLFIDDEKTEEDKKELIKRTIKVIKLFAEEALNYEVMD